MNLQVARSTDPGDGRALAIRPATPADAEALAEFGERTFRDAFAADNRPDDVESYVAATYSVERQRADLADPLRTTLVVESGGRLVAYAQLRAGPPPSCVTGPSPLELLRFYVERASHGRGVARTLMDAVRSAARAGGAETLWLGVWERNARAIAFYAKCGFRDAGSQPFILGSDRQTDRVMTLALEPKT